MTCILGYGYVFRIAKRLYITHVYKSDRFLFYSRQ